MGQINKIRQVLEREREKLINEVEMLKQRLEESAEDQEHLERKNTEALKKIDELSKSIDVTHYPIICSS